MSGFLIAITGLIYLYVCLEQYFKYGNIAMAVVYFGYALANVGLYYLAVKGTGHA
jgi:sorbitol-specific phosphotransferase system component IIC